MLMPLTSTKLHSLDRFNTTEHPENPVPLLNCSLANLKPQKSVTVMIESSIPSERWLDRKLVSKKLQLLLVVTTILAEKTLNALPVPDEMLQLDMVRELPSLIVTNEPKIFMVSPTDEMSHSTNVHELEKVTDMMQDALVLKQLVEVLHLQNEKISSLDSLIATPRA